MIRIELDEFSIDVPIEKRMTIQQFLAIAERLERISKRTRSNTDAWGFTSNSEPVYNTHETIDRGGFSAAPHETPHDNAFRFEHEAAPGFSMERVTRQLDGLSEMLARLERLERRLEEQKR